MSKLIWCGVVVAVSWVLMIGHACLAYLILRPGLSVIHNPCGINTPPYPNRMAAELPRNSPFVTTDSRAVITDYYRSDPRHIINFYLSYEDDWDQSVIIFDIPYEMPLQDVPCAKGQLTIYDYGFFRIASMDYVELNRGLTR